MNTEGTAAKVIELKKSRREYGTGSYNRRPNGRWQIQYYDSTGRKRRETFKTEAKAKQMLDKRTAQREAGVLGTATESRAKIDALAESYKLYAQNSAPKSAEWIEQMWRVHLQPYFGGKLAGRISTDDIQGYISARLTAGAASSTVNREVAILKAIFWHGAEQDPPKVAHVPKFPEKLREPNPRTGFVTDDQYKKLQAASKHTWLRALLALAYNYGFRKSELLGLRVSQIDLRERTIRLLPGTTKNDRGRVVVMTNEVYKLIAPCVARARPTDALFRFANEKPVLDFRGSWNRLVTDAGLPDLLLHDMRRSAVRRMIRLGVSKVIAKKISGHVTDSIFDRYDIVDESDLADAAKKLEAD